MMVRAGLSFLLSLSLAVPTTVAADTLVEKTFRRAFLYDLNNRVTAVMDLNLVRVDFLLECLEQMTDSQFSEVSTSNDPNHKPSPWTNCKDGVAQIRQNTRISYPLVRQRLLLSNLLLGGNVDILLVDLYQSIESKQKKNGRRLINAASILSRDLRVTNPLETWLSEEEIPNAPWQRSEVQAALAELQSSDSSKMDFNSLFQKGCEHTREKLRDKWGSNKLEFCRYTKLQSDEAGAVRFIYEGPESNRRTILNEINNYRSFQKDALRKFQSLAESEFKAMVQLNPYVGLVTSATPTRSEFINAFKIMRSRAETLVMEHQKLRQEKHLDDPEKADPHALLDLMRYTPIAASLTERPGPELTRVMKLMPMANVGETYEALTNSYFWQDLGDTAWLVTKAVAANMVACWLPVSKAGRFVMKAGTKLVKLERVVELFSASQAGAMVEALFTPLCYSVGGVAVNIGLLYHDVQNYNQVYREVFASVQEEELIRDVNALSEKERSVFWSFITVPVGSGLLKYSKDQFLKVATRMPPKVTEKMQETALRFAQ